MKLLVASLEKRKFAAGAASRQAHSPRRRGAAASTEVATASRGEVVTTSATTEIAASRTDDAQASGVTGGVASRADEIPVHRHERSRHVPATVRREVYERDAGRCSYVDARGERCSGTPRGMNRGRDSSPTSTAAIERSPARPRSRPRVPKPSRTAVVPRRERRRWPPFYSGT